MSIQQGPWDPSILAGSVAVITGSCNRGIGWGLAKHCAGILQMHVALIDLQQSVVGSARDELAHMYPDVQVFGVACDVSKPDDVHACAATVDRHFEGKRIGAVFANAGVLFQGVFERQPIQEWITTFNVNVIGVVSTIQAFLPLLQRSKEQSIIATTASVGGLMKGDGGSGSYMSSKHAVVALSESLSFELARRHPQIRVHTLLPTSVRTGLLTTTSVNKGQLVDDGSASDSVAAWEARGEGIGFAESPEEHARQVFDCIARAEFYVLGENVRPYVDHDFAFGALDRIRERYEAPGVLSMQLDNTDAIEPNTKYGFIGSPRSRVLKGPEYQELRRRDEEVRGKKSSKL